MFNFFTSRRFLTLTLCPLVISYLYVHLFSKNSIEKDESVGGIKLPNRWGTFRSGHYFGLKKNEPRSIVAGLMWFRNEIVDHSVPIRHWCNKFDGLISYSWQKHDFETFGIQEIVDKNFSISTQVLFLDHGWVSKISLKANESKESKSFDKPVSLIFYIAKENDLDKIHLENSPDDILKSKINIHGVTSKGVNFLSSIEVMSSKGAIIYAYGLETFTEPPLVNLKETILSNLYLVRSKDLPPDQPLITLRSQKADKSSPPNFIAIQIIVKKPVDVVFYLTEKLGSRDMEILKTSFDPVISEKIFNFDTFFDETLPLSKTYPDPDMIKFAQSAVSNMLGSVGYFYGHSLIRNDPKKEPVLYGPHELITAVPSRSFFPRGFLWDEGFHNLIISLFKPSLSKVIISNWLNLMNNDGWIPREVIFGNEAIARVPPEFVVQNTLYGNPPTLLLALDSMMKAEVLDEEYITSIFDKLELWYNWFNITQVGTKANTYRWRGRNPEAVNELNPKTLTSGLDDYPRASHPTNSEIHLDLRCWMAFASQVMSKMASFIHHPSASTYESTFAVLKDNQVLDSLHWSTEHQMYCDFGLHSAKVKLVKKPDTQITERQVLEKPAYGCVPEFGYVSLFPFIMNLLEPDSPKLEKILSDLKNPDLLWSPFGIRSLSKSSLYYRKYNTAVDPPYWRGAIWIQMNYLILRSLNSYSTIPGPFKESAKALYDELKLNIVSNMFKVYKKTGYIWEQYDDITGDGKGSNPFTGWSSLVVLIMAERY